MVRRAEQAFRQAPAEDEQAPMRAKDLATQARVKDEEERLRLEKKEVDRERERKKYET